HERLAGVLQAGRVVDEQAGRLDVHRTARVLELDALKIGDRPAKLLPLVQIAESVLESALSDAEHLRADADAAFVQGLDGDLVAPPRLPQHLVGADDAVVEDELAGAGGTDAELVLFLADA